MSSKRAVSVIALLVVAAGLFAFYLVGTKPNEDGSYALFAWLQFARCDLVPVIDYDGSQSLAFGLLYAPFFSLLGCSMLPFYVANMAFALVAFALFLFMAGRRTSLTGTLVFLACLVLNVTTYYHLMSNYWAVVNLWLALTLLPLFFIRDAFRSRLLCVSIAWVGTLFHTALLSSALVVTIFFLVAQRDFRQRVWLAAASVAGLALYSLYPLLAFGVAFKDLALFNSLYAAASVVLYKIGLWDVNQMRAVLHSPHIVPDERILFWRSPSYWLFRYLPSTLREHLPLFGTIVWICCLNWAAGTGNRRFFKDLLRDKRILLLAILPFAFGLSYSLFSHWTPPLLLRWYPLPLAMLAALMADSAHPRWSGQLKRLFWVVPLFLVAIQLYLYNYEWQYRIIRSPGYGISAIERVAERIRALTKPDDVVYSGYVPIALECRRPVMLEFVRGNRSDRIYDGKTVPRQLIFYETVLEKRPGAVVMTSYNWRDIGDRELTSQPDYELLMERRKRFEGMYEPEGDYLLPVKVSGRYATATLYRLKEARP